MKQTKTLSIIVDSAYEGDTPGNLHLYPHHPLENLLLALGQNGIANDIAKDLGLKPGNYWILSPVFFHTTHNDVLMVGVAEKKEQSLMYEALKTFVAGDGFELYRYQEHLWLIHAPNMPSLSSEILPKVMHQSLKPFLDQWPLVWRQWLTEVQMLFHAQGFSTANGVWLWGQGELVGHYQLKTYPLNLKCGIPGHLLLNDNEQFKTPALVITQAKYINNLAALSHKFKQCRYLWQNTDYQQNSRTLWQKIINWYHKKC